MMNSTNDNTSSSVGGNVNNTSSLSSSLHSSNAFASLLNPASGASSSNNGTNNSQTSTNLGSLGNSLSIGGLPAVPSSNAPGSSAMNTNLFGLAGLGGPATAGLVGGSSGSNAIGGANVGGGSIGIGGVPVPSVGLNMGAAGLGANTSGASSGSGNGGVEELLPLVIHLTNPEQVSVLFKLYL